MGQQLTMTPQLQQAIRLLQLSTLDLQQEIQEALESNPMLERQEEGDDFDNADPLADNIEQKPNPDVQEPTYQETAQTVDNLEDGDWGERIPNELPVDTAWEDIYQTSASSLPSNDDDEWDFTTRTSTGESLQSHLLWQLNLAPMSDTDRLIGVTLIDCINNQGYLDETLEALTFLAASSGTSCGWQHTWRNLSSASRMVICDLASPLDCRASRTVLSIPRRMVSYRSACAPIISTGITVSTLGGSSLATSALVRRSMNGVMRVRNCTMRALSPSFSMGVRNISLKRCWLPRKPGIKK